MTIAMATLRRNMAGTINSGILQIESAFDALDAKVHAIEPIRHAGVLSPQIADALFNLAHLVPHVIDGAANVAQMLENDVVYLGHGMRLPQLTRVVNAGQA